MSTETVVKIGAACLVLFWFLPRVYEPTFIRPDIYDSRRLEHHKRRWFNGDVVTKLEARHDQELGTWVWMSKARDGSWYRFFVEGPDSFDN
jgi:hypothetical protein